MPVLTRWAVVLMSILLSLSTSDALESNPVLAGTLISDYKSQNYFSPLYEGRGVDSCFKWNAECGKPAADYFCRINLGAQAVASNFTIMNNQPPTIVLYTKQVCNEMTCARFDSIACLIPAVYKDPTVNNIALDNCVTSGRDCGKPAADRFCKGKGYTFSVNYKILADQLPTYLWGGEKCTDLPCDRFTEISCQ